MINSILARATKGQPTPTVGMGATILHWTDRSAGTIVEVFKVKGEQAVAVQLDHARALHKGMTESQRWEYSRAPDACKYHFVFRDDRWKEIYRNQRTGNWIRTAKGYGGAGLRIGERDHYCDPSF